MREPIIFTYRKQVDEAIELGVIPESYFIRYLNPEDYYEKKNLKHEQEWYYPLPTVAWKGANGITHQNMIDIDGSFIWEDDYETVKVAIEWNEYKRRWL